MLAKEFLFGKVTDFWLSILLKTGFFTGVSQEFCQDFKKNFFPEQLWVAAFITIVYYDILVYSLEFQ